MEEVGWLGFWDKFSKKSSSLKKVPHPNVIFVSCSSWSLHGPFLSETHQWVELPPLHPGHDMVPGSRSGMRRRLGTPLTLQRQPHRLPVSPAAAEARPAGNQERERGPTKRRGLFPRNCPSLAQGLVILCIPLYSVISPTFFKVRSQPW